MTPTRLALTMRRNDDPLRLQFNISDDGRPIDMTSGYAAAMQVRLDPGTTGDPLVDLVDDTPTAAGSVITLNDTGFELVIFKGDIAAPGVPVGPEPGEAFTGAYDILITEPGGDTNPWYCGDFIVEEGVTVLP